MNSTNITNQILMGEFPLELSGIEKFLDMGEEIRLFQNEYLDSKIINEKFVIFVKYGKMAYIISRPDKTTFRFLTMNQNITFFSNAITPYTKYSQSWDIVALENTILIAFDKSQLQQMIKASPEFAEEFLMYATVYPTIMQKRTLLTANLTSSQRVLTWLFGLCQVEDEAKTEYAMPCELNQQEIADILILHISTCNKIFCWLDENGVVKKTKSHLYINYPALKQCIAEDWKIY
ncbi:MAG: hypothetical protein RRY40_01410 [Oscillospiraceae bacterium]